MTVLKKCLEKIVHSDLMREEKLTDVLRIDFSVLLSNHLQQLRVAGFQRLDFGR